MSGMERKHVLWIVGVAIALVVLAPLGLQVKKAASQDPAFCLSCHQMDGPYLAWATSPHAQVTCVKCHPGSLASDLRHAWLGVVKRVDTIEGKAGVDQGACVECHVEGGHPDWPAVAATSGHRVHDGKTVEQCVGCHGSTEHVERAASEVCGDCHGQELTLSGMASTVHCLDCHNFLAEGDELTPVADTCRGCHTAGEHPITAHATLDCLTCHGPHDPHQPEATPCVDCHDRPSHDGHLQCLDCHTPHDRDVPIQRCAECHDQRKGLHGKPAHQQCLTCHRPHHATRPDEYECSACHADLYDTHASKGCVGCHTFRKDL